MRDMKGEGLRWSEPQCACAYLPDRKLLYKVRFSSCEPIAVLYCVVIHLWCENNVHIDIILNIYVFYMSVKRVDWA
jgi:hypothetical protein